MCDYIIVSLKKKNILIFLHKILIFYKFYITENVINVIMLLNCIYNTNIYVNICIIYNCIIHMKAINI